MDKKTRAVYKTLGTAFIVIGLGFIAVTLAERLFRFEFFSGNALPVAVFLGLIGAALLYTVKQIDEDEAQD